MEHSIFYGIKFCTVGTTFVWNLCNALLSSEDLLNLGQRAVTIEFLFLKHLICLLEIENS